MKNNKLLLIFLFALLFVLLLASDSFAVNSDEFVVFNNSLVTETIDDVCDYKELVKDYKYYFVYCRYDSSTSHTNWDSFKLIAFNDLSQIEIANNYFLFQKGEFFEARYYFRQKDVWDKKEICNYTKNSLMNFKSNSNVKILYHNFDFTLNDGTIIHKSTELKLPSISTSLEDLQTLNFDNLSISGNDYSEKDIYLLVYDYTKAKETADITEIYPKKEILLNTKSKYFIKEISVGNSIYFIPIEDLGVTYKVRRQICI